MWWLPEIISWIWGGSESRAHEDAMIELCSDRILEHIAPPTISTVHLLRIPWIQQLLSRRYDPSSHRRKLVVYQSSVESGHKGAGDSGEKYHNSCRTHECLVSPDCRGSRNLGESRTGRSARLASRRHACHLQIPPQSQRCMQHADVKCKSGAQVSGESIL